MCRPQPCGALLAVHLAVLLAGFLVTAPRVAHAQDQRLQGLEKERRQFGMDSATFRRFFGAAFARARPARESNTVEELADQVTEVRLFLTKDPNVVIGEIVVEGKTRLTEVVLPLEAGRVAFLDGGKAPDKRRGDGIFTAQFRMPTDRAWQSARQSLTRSVKAVRAPEGRAFVRRGPRDIVPVKDALESLKAQAPSAFSVLADSADRVARVAEARNPIEGAKLARIDIAATPFLTLPGPGFEPRKHFDFQQIFGIPVIDLFPFPLPVSIDRARSLMVVEPTVVEDGARTFDVCTGAGTPGGAWSFGHLMRELAHGTGMSAENFTMHWLSNWILLQEANGFLVNEPMRGARLQSEIIASWLLASGGTTLNVDQFPARLLAIVNRPDLADKIGYGVAGSAGEGRLVFGLLQKTSGGCFSIPFTVIFEYGIKGGSCSAVKAWHQRWKDLDANPVGSNAYNTALEAITRDFTDHGSNPAQSPNASSLNQLRTNEIALNSPWQLREFRLQSAGSVPPGLLDLVTVKQTPDLSFNGTATTGSATLTAYIVGNEVDILNDRHVVPERFPTILDPFLGAVSDVPSSSTFWHAPGLTSPPMTNPAEARRKFSLGTCSGCHAGETNTFFTHIGSVGTRNPGSAAVLSGFLTGIDVPDPASLGPPHHYEDLTEREKAMSHILTSSCFGLLGLRRLPFVH